MAHELPALPYAHDALEPHVDKATMEIHHGKHHAAYVANLNKALAGSPVESQSLCELVKGIASVPENIRGPVRNNGGGHWNHSFFWKLMAPNAGGAPTGDIAAAINAAFGSFADFQAKFEAGNLLHGESRQPSHGQSRRRLRRNADPRLRCLGARLLPQIPKQARRLSEGLLERRELG